MTDGLVVLLAWMELVIVLGILAWVLLRRTPPNK